MAGTPLSKKARPEPLKRPALPRFFFGRGMKPQPEPPVRQEPLDSSESYETVSGWGANIAYVGLSLRVLPHDKKALKFFADAGVDDSSSLKLQPPEPLSVSGNGKSYSVSVVKRIKRGYELSVTREDGSHVANVNATTGLWAGKCEDGDDRIKIRLLYDTPRETVFGVTVRPKEKPITIPPLSIDRYTASPVKRIRFGYLFRVAREDGSVVADVKARWFRPGECEDNGVRIKISMPFKLEIYHPSEDRSPGMQ